MLKEFLTENLIETNYLANTWQESVAKACDLLVNANKCKKGYFDEIVQAVKEFGPYFVIVPGIAFVHAKSSGTILDDCLCIVHLKKPVYFWHELNDPVKLVIAFGCKYDNEHLDILQNLSLMLCDGNNLEKIMNIGSKEDILEIIKNY